MTELVTNRRQFLFGAGAAALAVSAGINIRQAPRLWGDGVHDDTDALNAFFRGEKIETKSGVITCQDVLAGGVFRISAPIIISRDNIQWHESIIQASGGGPAIQLLSNRRALLSGLRISAPNITPNEARIKVS